MRTALDQRGMTLVETLVAVAIFVTVISIPISVLFVGEASGRYMGTWEDQNQTLRLAMKQITDDVAFAQWIDDGSTEFTVSGYLPFTKPKADDPSFWTSALSDWPGDFNGVIPITIKYELQVADPNTPDDYCLWRSLSYDAGSSGRQLVACGLMATSHVKKTGQILEVQLDARQTSAGVTRIAQVHTKIFLGQGISAAPLH